MLIVCPNCTTSYTIDPASVGPAGRMVRCARCKSTWFAGAPANEVDAFVDGVIAEAEAEHTAVIRPDTPPPPTSPNVTAVDDFSAAFAAPSFSAEPSFTAPAVHAEPVSIPDSPSLVPPIDHMADAAPAPAPAADTNDELETFAARRRRMQTRRKKSRTSSRWLAVVLVLLALNVALIGARSEIVRHFPQTASLFAAIGLPVNLRQLTFEKVRITREVQDGVTILMVEGEITSEASKSVEVPRLRFAARNAAGQEVYTWTAKPERSILEPGQRLPFSSRLASPPSDAYDVMVRFFNASDATAGKK